MAQEVKMIKVADIAAMLDNGMNREQIAKHYGVPVSTLKTLMAASPTLRGKRVNTNPVKIVLMEEDEETGSQETATAEDLGQEIEDQNVEEAETQEESVPVEENSSVSEPWVKL